MYEFLAKKIIEEDNAYPVKVLPGDNVYELEN